SASPKRKVSHSLRVGDQRLRKTQTDQLNAGWTLRRRLEATHSPARPVRNSGSAAGAGVGTTSPEDNPADSEPVVPFNESRSAPSRPMLKSIAAIPDAKAALNAASPAKVARLITRFPLNRGVLL